jgi:hypothetical protein
VLGSTLAWRLTFALFLLEAAVIVFSLVLSLARPGHAGLARTLLDTGLPSLLSGGLIVAGVFCQLTHRHQPALRLLQWAVQVELLFTQVVIFNRQQWLGLVGFAIAIVVLGVLRVLDPLSPTVVSRIKPRD